MGYQEAYDKLKKYGQLHVLQYYEELSDAQKEALLAQIMDTDLSVLEQCRHKEELNPWAPDWVPMSPRELITSG